MRTDDPVILGVIQSIEAQCEALRRICGFPPLLKLPETTASRKAAYQCPYCTRSCFTAADLAAHLVDHGEYGAVPVLPKGKPA